MPLMCSDPVAGKKISNSLNDNFVQKSLPLSCNLSFELSLHIRDFWRCIFNLYRVSQEFVPLILCTITFDQNFIFTWNSTEMFISLSRTCIQKFSYWHTLSVLFCFVVFLSHSVAVAAWSGILRVDPQMIYIELFITWCAGASSAPKQYLFSLGSWKNIRHSSKKDNHPFHSKAFVLLYKFQTSWALLGRLRRGFFCHLRGL